MAEITCPRSPYDMEGGLYFFPRMLDKIRLDIKGTLGPDYLPRLGKGMDGLLCQFLGVRYDSVRERVEEGKTDVDILEWCQRNGIRRGTFDVMLFNKFLAKLGWRDEDYGQRLHDYKVQQNLVHRADIETLFDFIEVDEKMRE